MSEFIDPLFWLRQLQIYNDLVDRIKIEMSETYSQVYKFRDEYKSYLDVFARIKSTNFEDL